jgi:hypothetical protein
MRCRTVWFAANTAALSGIAAAHRLEMAQFATADLEPGGTAAPHPGASLATGGAGADAPFPAGPDDTALTDGEIRVVDDAPSLAEADPGAALAETASSELDRNVVTLEATASAEFGGEDIETVAARRARAAKGRRKALRLPGLPTIILMLVALDLGLVGWRTEIVRWVPQMAPLYAAIGLPVNIRGLLFTDVTVETQSHEGVAVLVVQGTIVSTATQTVDVPRLRFAVRNASGDELYKWTALPNRPVLAAGQTLAFQSRLASPPPETHDVLVRFFTRRDLHADLE